MRVQGWRNILADYVAGAARAPYQPGIADCALFAAGAVDAITGSDHRRVWAGRYRCVTGGRRLVRAAGHADLVALVASSFAEVPVAYARPGDLAALAGSDGPALGVVQGEGIYVLTPAGLATVPLLTALRAFRVG